LGIKKNMLKNTILAFLAVVMITGGLAAQAQEPRWHLRCHGLIVDGDEDFSVDDGSGGRVLAGGDVAPGLGIALEYRATSWVGFELGTAFAKTPDLDLELTTGGEVSDIGEGPGFVPLMASVNFHLTPKQPFDLYLGPTVALVCYGDFDLDIDGESREFEADGDFAWGGTIGVDIPFGDSPWAFNSSVTYLSSEMEISEVGSSEITTISHDPLMVKAGITFSF